MTGWRRLFVARRLAWACAGLVFVVTCLSAFVRLASAADGVGPGANAITMARGAHRVSASLALVLAIVLFVWCYTSTPPLRRQGRIAGAVVALGLFLALVGRFGADSALAAVVLTNFLGGLVMLVIAIWLALAFTP